MPEGDPVKLYREVLISSAEQAEALPDDAIVISVETGYESRSDQ